MFSIAEFRNNIKIVRPNLFYAKCYIPPLLSGFEEGSFRIMSITPDDMSAMEFSRTFAFRCEATEFPGRSVATNDDLSFGPARKFAYDVTYNDINLQIIASTDMNERKIFERWVDNIITPAYKDKNDLAGGLSKYYDDYSNGRIEINQIDDKGKVLAKCMLNNAFPIAISPMNLAWADSDQYQRFSVTIAYRYHVTTFS